MGELKHIINAINEGRKEVLDELEKWAIDERKYWENGANVSDYNNGYIDAMKKCIAKIQELKEGK